MPAALDTEGINAALVDVVEYSKEYLILISPFLKFAPKIKKLIENASERGVNIVVVYGKHELSNDEMDWLRKLKNIQISYLENLHAKYYGNEEASILCSMNLYDFSQINNDELGVFACSKEREDRQLFYELLEFVDRIIDRSKIEYATVRYNHEIKDGMLKSKHNHSFSVLAYVVSEHPVPELQSPQHSEQAYCIRCGKQIPLEEELFFCKPCFSRWIQYRNPNYSEKFCHICGKPCNTSAYRPLCNDCYPGHSDLCNKKRNALLKKIQ